MAVAEQSLNQEPVCVLLTGLPATGKTRILRAIKRRARTSSFPVITHDVDEIEVPGMRGVNPASPMATKARYELMHGMIEQELKEKNNVVAGAVYTSDVAKQEAALHITKIAGGKLVVVQLDAPIKILTERLARRRSNNPSPLRSVPELLEVWERFKAFDNPKPVEVIDTSKTSVSYTVGVIFSQFGLD